MYRGKTVFGPNDLKNLDIEAVLVIHYNLRKDIIVGLTGIAGDIKIIDLHNDNDIDWFDISER